MNSKTSFINFITDSFGTFSATDTADARWKKANLLIDDIGGTAVNIGAIDLDSQAPSWMLSSMSQEWLEQYTNEKLYEIDPFIPHLKSTNKPYVLDTEKTVTGQPLNSKLLSAGYHFLYGLPFSGSRKNERQIVTYCTDVSYENLLKGDALERIRILAAVIITQFSAPDKRETHDIILFDRNPLTEREKEALIWLAHGMQNLQIAEKMGISEVMVRKHLKSARDKTGAITREQALGIAIHRNLIKI